MDQLTGPPRLPKPPQTGTLVNRKVVATVRTGPEYQFRESLFVIYPLFKKRVSLCRRNDLLCPLAIERPGESKVGRGFLLILKLNICPSAGRERLAPQNRLASSPLTVCSASGETPTGFQLAKESHIDPPAEGYLQSQRPLPPLGRDASQIRACAGRRPQTCWIPAGAERAHCPSFSQIPKNPYNR
jgi:hypothetical protein